MIKDGNNKNKVKINDFNILYINLQLITTIVSLILFVVSIFKHAIFKYFFLSIGITLVAMGFSNKYVYKKDELTKSYFISGVLVIVFSLLRIFGVI